MTKRDQLSLQDYLSHIHEAITRINSYLMNIDHAAFLENKEKQDAVIRNLEVIGEAASNIRRHFPEFADQHPDFPLLSAYEMRNVLIHGYFIIDLDIIWSTIEKDLPLLEMQVNKLLRNL